MNRIYAATGDDFALLVPATESTEGSERSSASKAESADPKARVPQHWEVSITLRGLGVQCLAVDPKSADTLFVGSHGHGVYKSTDGGRTWTALDFPERDVFSVAVSPVDGAVYAGCEPSKLFRSNDGGESWTELAALRAIPSAPTWSFPPRPWTSHVRWIAPNPHDANRLIAGIELGGIMLTEDGGATWRDHPPQAVKDCHSVIWHPTAPGRAYEAGGGGAAWSKDAAVTWERAETGLDLWYAWSVAVDPEDPDCWYVSASPGPGHAHRSGNAEAYIYRWQGEGPWEKIGEGLESPLTSMPYALVATERGVLAGFRNGRIAWGEGRGDRWSELTLSGEPLTSVCALAIR